MINNDRIVPIAKIDWLSAVGTFMNLASVSYTKLAAATTDGGFTLTGSGSVGNVLCDQPVRKLNIASGVTACVIYFVAAYDYEGFQLNLVDTETAGVDVVPDGVTLYSATLSSGTVTIAKVTP